MIRQSDRGTTVPVEALFTLRMRMSTEPVTPTAHRSRRDMRAEIEASIERMLAALDAMDGDPDLEPSLGWTSDGSSRNAGGTDDREDDPSDEGEPDSENEPTLGASGGMNQSAWSQGYSHLHGEDEPSLGWHGGEESQLPHDLAGSELHSPGADHANLDRERDAGDEGEGCEILRGGSH